jgi:antimicrobial peptide system SdpA family protein
MTAIGRIASESAVPKTQLPKARDIPRVPSVYRQSREKVRTLSVSNPPRMMTSKKTRKATIALYSLAWSAIAVVVALRVARTALPENAAVPTSQPLSALHILLPQGWSFFTRDPREERISVFVRRGPLAWTNASSTTIADPRNAFGLDRTSRAQGLEVSHLVASVPDTAWTPCRYDSTICLDSVYHSDATANRVANPRLCGEVGIVLRPPVPWAWRHSAGVRMLARVARLTVRC